MINVNVKAISPDNSSEIRRIISLLNKTYGKTYLKNKIVTPEFWEKSISSRFISLVSYYEGRLIGHLAFRRDPYSKSTVELILAAISQESAEIAEIASNSLIQRVYQIADQQGWNLLYSHTNTLFPQLIDFAVFSESFYGMNILPANISHSKKPSWNLTLYNNLGTKLKRTKLLVPSWHKLICQRLSSGINLSFSDNPDDFSGNNTEIGADNKAIEFERFCDKSMIKLYVCPSLMNTRDLLAAIPRFDNPIINIDMKDPRSLELCEQLEGAGFRFCGISPYLRNSHYIVYNSLPEDGTIDSDSMPDPRMKMLANYVNDYNISGANSSWSLRSEKEDLEKTFY